MAGHVVNRSTKFENPTPIRSCVMSYDDPLGYHRPCVRHHFARTVSPELCVAANFSHIFELPNPDLSIHSVPYGSVIEINRVIYHSGLRPCVKGHTTSSLRRSQIT